MLSPSPGYGTGYGPDWGLDSPFRLTWLLTMVSPQKNLTITTAADSFGYKTFSHLVKVLPQSVPHSV